MAIENLFRVVVPTDFSESSEKAVEYGIAVARRERAELHLLAVVDNHQVPLSRTETFNDRVEEAREGLLSLVPSPGAEEGDPARVLVHVRVGHPADEIVHFATDVDADLVVMGTHGRRGFKRWVMGSVAERVVRLAPCPVLVVRPKVHEVEAEDELVPEPPCPQCVLTRRESGGQKWWCEVHDQPPTRPHRYGYSSLIDFGDYPGHVL